MTKTHPAPYCTLSQKDLELLEGIICKNGDDIAVSIARSFQRIEERMEAAESRICNRVAELEDKLESRAAVSIE